MAGDLPGGDDKWDDSELINDWNQAYNEYKKYHSLAARGEQADPADIAEIKPKVDSEKASEPIVPQVSASKPSNFVPGNGTEPELPAQHPQIPAFSMPNLPQAVLGAAQNEDLKNIMMSWYYAGYYTGLYDGQQKAYASMQEQQG